MSNLAVEMLRASAGVDGGAVDPLNTDVVAHWNFNDDYTDAANSNDGTGTATSFVTGNFGNAVLFDNVGDSVNVPYSADLNPPYGSLNFWVYLSSTPNPFSHVYEYYVNSSPYGQVPIIIKSNRRAVSYMRNTAITSIFCDTGIEPTIALTTWTMVSMTYGTAYLRTFINGSKTAETSNGGLAMYQPTLGVKMGNSVIAGRSFPGRVDNMTWWKRELTETEVSELYNSGSGRTFPF